MKNLIRSNDNIILGHGAAIFSIVVWGTTFISTKVLLRSFSPVEILFLRFLIGYLALWVAQPKPIRGTDWRQELTYAAAGLSGVTFYFLFGKHGAHLYHGLQCQPDYLRRPIFSPPC